MSSKIFKAIGIITCTLSVDIPLVFQDFEICKQMVSEYEEKKIIRLVEDSELEKVTINPINIQKKNWVIFLMSMASTVNIQHTQFRVFLYTFPFFEKRTYTDEMDFPGYVIVKNKGVRLSLIKNICAVP